MEKDTIPAVCDKCLGDNPYLRMTREHGGEQCHMCQRPYTSFRWVASKGNPWSKTTICKSCARVKNCCQSCMLDLTYGLPIAIRDEALKMANSNNQTAIEGSTDRTRLYAIAQQEQENEEQEQDDSKERARDLLRRLANARDKKVDNSEIKDKEARNNSIINKLPFNSTLTPPNDKSITSFFIFGIDADLAEADVRNYFSKFGDIRSLQIVHKMKCGFVNFMDRNGAEAAADSISKNKNGNVVIKGCKFKAVWGKPRPLSGFDEGQVAALAQKAMKGKVKMNIKKKPQKVIKQAESVSSAASSESQLPSKSSNNTFEL